MPASPLPQPRSTGRWGEWAGARSDVPWGFRELVDGAPAGAPPPSELQPPTGTVGTADSGPSSGPRASPGCAGRAPVPPAGTRGGHRALPRDYNKRTRVAQRLTRPTGYPAPAEDEGSRPGHSDGGEQHEGGGGGGPQWGELSSLRCREGRDGHGEPTGTNSRSGGWCPPLGVTVDSPCAVDAGRGPGGDGRKKMPFKCVSCGCRMVEVEE